MDGAGKINEELQNLTSCNTAEGLASVYSEVERHGGLRWFFKPQLYHAVGVLRPP